MIRGIQSRRFGRDSVTVSWRDSDREFGCQKRGKHEMTLNHRNAFRGASQDES
jgi:hypothetical protein